MFKIKLKIQYLPLILLESQKQIAYYNHLQDQIIKTNKLNLIQRLQQARQAIQLRIKQLDKFFTRVSQDQRAKYIITIKLMLQKSISPINQFNQIAVNTQNKEKFNNIQLGRNKQIGKINNNNKSPINTQRQTTPIKKNQYSNDQLSKQQQKFILQDNSRQNGTKKSTAAELISQRTLKQEKSIKSNKDSIIKNQTKAKRVDNLQKLIMTIKMTKQQYIKFMKEMEYENSH